MKLKEAITDFLESTDFEHVNRHTVKIELEDDFTFSANSSLLEYTTDDGNDNSIAVELFCNKNKFVRILQIKAVGDIENITQQQLLQSFQDGEAVMVCFVDLVFSCCMVFKKQGIKIMAKNESNEQHEVTVQLVTPREYINYTRQYYTLKENFSDS